MDGNIIPAISIILPIYNVENYLRRCLEALLAQTIDNIEVIMVDDGSSDGSPAICDEYASNYPNFRVIHKSNGGVSSARNCGLKYASGKYVAFCDPDDFYNQDSMETFLRIASEKDSQCQLFVGEGYNIVNENGDCYSTPISNNDEYILNIDNAIIYMENNKIAGVPWNKLFLNSIIKSYFLTFNTEYAAHEDKLFILQYMQYIDRVCIFPNHIYNYYQRSGSLTTNFKNLRKRVIALNECVDLSYKVFSKKAYISQLRWCGAWLKVYLKKCYMSEYRSLYSLKDKIFVFKAFATTTIKYFFNIIFH